MIFLKGCHFTLHGDFSVFLAKNVTKRGLEYIRLKAGEYWGCMYSGAHALREQTSLCWRPRSEMKSVKCHHPT
jgi:hypothetical protein